jgi:long-chain acyl-CoA synthetase
MLERPWLTSWLSKIPDSLEFPEISLGEVLRRSAAKARQQTAVWCQGTSLTYTELDALADRFGATLQSFGIVKGDRVAIYLPNLPQFVIAYYGALKVGAVVVTASPLYKERELAHILVDSAARVLICWDRLYPIAQTLSDKVRLKHVITTKASDNFSEVMKASKVLDAKSTDCSGAWDMKLLLTKHTGQTKAVEIEVRKDLALLQYSGGTTGAPKGAMLTHYNLVANAVQFAAWLYMNPGGEVHLSALPFFHIYGMTTAMNAPIYTRSSMILIPDARDINAILQAIDTHKPTIFCGVPAMYIALINQPDIKKHDLRSIRVCVSGSSPLPVEVQRKFEELTGGRLVEGYGLSEASPVTHINPLDDTSKNRPGSIGIPISDTQAKIVDLETGERDLPVGTLGELVVRGPQVMLGYWNNLAETRMTIRDGWLFTGDIATMDSDGYFRIVDRKKDMINISGLKVWPREVEEVLYEHPAVKEAAVVAVPDAISGEAVKAFVVLKEEYIGKVSSEEISRFCKEKIATYKAPKIVEFRESLPKTPVGKILRRELRAGYSKLPRSSN